MRNNFLSVRIKDRIGKENSREKFFITKMVRCLCFTVKFGCLRSGGSLCSHTCRHRSAHNCLRRDRFHFSEWMNATHGPSGSSFPRSHNKIDITVGDVITSATLIRLHCRIPEGLIVSQSALPMPYTRAPPNRFDKNSGGVIIFVMLITSLPTLAWKITGFQSKYCRLQPFPQLETLEVYSNNPQAFAFCTCSKNWSEQ